MKQKKKQKYKVITPDEDVWFIWATSISEAKKHLPEGSKVKEIITNHKS